MVKYFAHKDNCNVVCEIIDNYIRFSRWVRKENTITEIYTFKDITPEFRASFVEISINSFNNIWGKKLQEL